MIVKNSLYHFKLVWAFIDDTWWFKMISNWVSCFCLVSWILLPKVMVVWESRVGRPLIKKNKVLNLLTSRCKLTKPRFRSPETMHLQSSGGPHPSPPRPAHLRGGAATPTPHLNFGFRPPYLSLHREARDRLKGGVWGRQRPHSNGGVWEGAGAAPQNSVSV